MGDNRIKNWFKDQIELQRQSSMRFTGKHNVVQPESTETKEVVDFDFHTQMSEFCSLEMIQMKRLDIADKIFMIITEDDETGGNELVQQAIEKLTSITAPGYGRITFENVFINYDGMLTSLRTWANRASYGGRVEFNNENTSGSLDLGSSGGPRIGIQAVWKYKWNTPKAQSRTRHALPTTPNLRPGPKPKTWDLRIQHAMVDGQTGAIGLGDETSGFPMIKAVAKYALHETLTTQGNFGTSKIHKWGLDEPNDEPPYVGARHFGGAGRTELPPPYNE
ncbi:hypothetical protein E4T48_01875 [Aureobasidium sp. EXF-10727]|nr:hypothetical protein E4T48_01875 [Aureobasidium sp. EXF-10727]